jgi:radical SAM-linked protein
MCISLMRQRLRVTFTKDEPLRYTSNLDVLRLWDRAFRRAGIPVAYSQGFNPTPKITIAAALPLGMTSDCELMDVVLEPPMGPAEFLARLVQQLPPGVRLVSAVEAPLNAPALPAVVRQAEYQVQVEAPANVVAEAIARALAASSLPRQRRGRNYDLRPLIDELRIESAESTSCSVWMRLRAEAGATGRPDEVMDCLGLAEAVRAIRRTRLVLADAERAARRDTETPG